MSTVIPLSAEAGDFSDMPKIMTTEMLAEQLPDVSKRTLEDWRWRKVGPVAVRDEQTRRVYYLKSDVVAWFTGNRHHENEKPAVAAAGQNTNA